MANHRNTPAKFWGLVDKSAGPEACWPWQGAKSSTGYGNFRVHFRQHGTHRLAYELAVGPAGRLFVCHRCDNPACCNPAHLFLGTQLDNMRDRRAKGR